MMEEELKHRYDAFLFDLDGTLINSMPMHYNAWTESFKKNGAVNKFTEEIFYEWGGKSLTQVVQDFNILFEESLDVEATARGEIEFSLAHVDDVLVKEDVHNFAIKMKNAGKPVAVVSGNRREYVEKILERKGLRDLFDAVVTGDDVQKSKPDPEPFLMAAKLLKVEPSRCYVLEDAEAGRQSAVAAGMDCFLVE